MKLKIFFELSSDFSIVKGVQQNRFHIYLLNCYNFSWHWMNYVKFVNNTLPEEFKTTPSSLFENSLIKKF